MPGSRGLPFGRPQQQAPHAQFLEERKRSTYPFGLIPPKGILHAYLSSTDVSRDFDSTGLGVPNQPYEGWAICNGQNDTPDLRDRFIRSVDDAAGTTGGSDSSAHTHAIDHDHASFTSAAESGHTHAINHDHASFTSGSEASHTHGTEAEINGSLRARIDFDTTAEIIYADADASGADAAFTADRETGALAGGITTSTSSRSQAVIVMGATDAGSSHSHSVDVPALTGTSGASSGHTHSIDVPALTGTSGAASATDNRPAFYELVALMRVDRGSVRSRTVP